MTTDETKTQILIFADLDTKRQLDELAEWRAASEERGLRGWRSVIIRELIRAEHERQQKQNARR